MDYKAIIIEDEPDMVDLYDLAFSPLKKDISCEIFMDGSTAFESLNNVRYDLIICDLNLPDMRGMDLIKKLRKSSANVTSLIFIVSGNITTEITDFANDFKDIKIFDKPIPSIPKFAEECLEIVKTRKELKYDPELLETVRESAFDLLKNYFDKEPIIGRCQLSPLNTSPTSIRGFIPFHGGEFTGTMSVDLGKGFIETFQKKSDMEATLDAKDIAYEMANELAGQFKASVLKKGYDLTLGIPSVKTLEEVENLRPKEDDVVYIPAGYIGSLFRIEFTMSVPDFSYSKKQEVQDSLDGGQVFLFD